MKCLYTIGNSKNSLSYDQLLKDQKIDKAANADTEHTSDILFSLGQVSPQVVTYDKFIEMIKSLKGDVEVGLVTGNNGSPLYRAAGAVPLATFINSSLCQLDRYTQFVEADFKSNKINQLIREGKEKKDAIIETDELIKASKRLNEISPAIHKMLNSTSMQRGNRSMMSQAEISDEDAILQDKFLDMAPESMKDPNVIQKLLVTIKDINEKICLGGYKVLRNINMIQDTTANISVFEHIDVVTIAPDGTIQVYLYKTSLTDHKDWVDEKKQNYKYTLSFIKQTLAAKGFNVENIQLNIIPIIVSYDENDPSKVKNIREGEIQRYSDSKKGYAMASYDNQTRKYIHIAPDIKTLPESIDTQSENEIDLIIPDLYTTDEYVGKQVQDLIEDGQAGRNPNLFIKKSDTPGKTYVVEIHGEQEAKIEVTDPKKPINNEQIKKIVREHLYQLNEDKGVAANRLKNAFIQYFKYGKLIGPIKEHSFIRQHLRKYMVNEQTDPKTGETIYDWELLDSATSNNILIFRNRKTNVYDFVSLSALNLNLGFQRNLLYRLGYQNSEYVDLEDSNGNIEMLRLMLYINNSMSLLPENAKLGTMTVVSRVGADQAIHRSIDVFYNKYFKRIVQLANRKNGSKKQITLKLNEQQLGDPIECILDMYNVAVKDNYAIEKGLKNVIEIDDLQAALNGNKADKIVALYDLIKSIGFTYPSLYNAKELRNMMGSTDERDRVIANIFSEAIQAYNYLTGNTAARQMRYNDLDMRFMKGQNVSSYNMRLIVNNMSSTNSAISKEFLSYYQDNIRHQLDDFYSAIGYTKAQNLTLGNQAIQFENLYEKDPVTGKKTMLFKNPYDENADLTQPERTLLKHVLFQIADILQNGIISQQYHTCNNERFAKLVTQYEYYRWVPLEKASKSSQVKDIRTMLNSLENLRRSVMSSQTYDLLVEGITEQERAYMEDESGGNVLAMRVTNPFDVSMPYARNDPNEARNRRTAMIEKYGVDYFETNIENLLIDIAMKQITAEQYQKFVIVTKGILLERALIGNSFEDNEIGKKETQWVRDYLSVNVFHKPAMSKTMANVVGKIHPLKTMVSHVLVGFNLIGNVRDLMEGFQQNFLRSLIKFNTDIDAKNIRKAYSFVVTHENMDPASVNLLNRLCLNFRLSNMDALQVAERAKTGRAGLTNISSLPYYTLRSPDFTNRMVLFVARCMQDGCWDAFSLNEKGDLVYDQKKDKRFAAYLNDNRSDIKAYKEAKSAYFSQVRMYNDENPNDQIDPINFDEKPLPIPYTNRQIANIRSVADNIYGAYDRSMRPMADNHSYWIMFGMFTTWFNGIMANYFMAPQESITSPYTHEQETDAEGNLIFIDDIGNQVSVKEVVDENGNRSYYDTNGNAISIGNLTAVYRDTPMIIQGIYHTVKTSIGLCRKEGLEHLKEYLRRNPHERANLRKLLSDFLMSLFWLLVINLAMKPGYKEYKKEMKDNPVLQNFLVEILYKGSTKSWDQFQGPINIVTQFGENMNPPFYSVPQKLITDTMKFVFGDKEFSTLLTGNVALFRNFKDTWKAYNQSLEQ